MKVPNLQALVALESVARLGSVTSAAAALHLTQSAVSHRLHGLQRELGVPLIEREGRGIALTREARELAQATSYVIAHLNDLIARISPSGLDQVLSISCSPSFAIRFLVSRVSTFRQQHPALDLRIASADVPVDAVHGVDVAIHLSSGPSPKLFCAKLIDEVVFPVVSPRLIGKGGRPWTLAELLKHPLIHDEALLHDPQHVGWRSWLQFAGLPSGKGHTSGARGLRFSHAYLAIEAALAGDGVALARRSLVADDLARGRLLAPIALAMPSGLAYWFVSAVDPQQRPAVALLREFLGQQLLAAERTAAKQLRMPRTTRRQAR
jgi:LysR family glycine cleavage system transcriptional activator